MGHRVGGVPINKILDEQIPAGTTYYENPDFTGSTGTTQTAMSYTYIDDIHSSIAITSGSTTTTYYIHTPITNLNFYSLSNRWDSIAHRLFIQPNINIKGDATNPDEIVFEDGGRVNIVEKTTTNPTTGKPIDITFDKLDNTQWLWEGTAGDAHVAPSSVIPQTNYSIYTCFMDSAPMNLFYGRLTPTITINGGLDAETATTPVSDFDLNNPFEYRDITFVSALTNDTVGVKYYQYTLYNVVGNELDQNIQLIEVDQSEEIYSNDLQWKYRGLVNNEKYNIKLVIVDEYDKVFTDSETFEVNYGVGQSGNLDVSFDCEEGGNKISLMVPLTAISTDYLDKETVTEDNIVNNDYVSIPEGKILNYTNIDKEDFPPLDFLKDSSLLATFRITDTFARSIEAGSEKEVCSFSVTNEGIVDEYTLKISGYQRFYMDNDQLQDAGDILRFKLYKGSTQLTGCFVNGIGYTDYCDYSSLITRNLIIPDNLNYALQSATTNFILTSNITYNSGTPVYYDGGAMQDAELNHFYYLTIDSAEFQRGLYKVDNNKWVLENTKEFLFLEQASQLNTFTMTIPTGLKDGSDNYLWAETDGAATPQTTDWIDTSPAVDNINANILNTTWITLYLIINSSAETHPVIAQLTAKEVI